jgi:hypothetical protein
MELFLIIGLEVYLRFCNVLQLISLLEDLLANDLNQFILIFEPFI